MTERSRCQQLDAELLAAAAELVGRLIGAAEHVASRLKVPTIVLKALHNCEGPISMKDLSKRMHCDPSFVTAVADILEQHGLARREPHPGDRRIKNLVLTDEGIALKDRVEAELASAAPWNQALTQAEREQLVVLLRKMTAGPPLSGEPAPAHMLGSDHHPADAAGTFMGAR